MSEKPARPGWRSTLTGSAPKLPEIMKRKSIFCSSKPTTGQLLAAGIISKWNMQRSLNSIRLLPKRGPASKLRWTENYAFSYLDLLFDYQITISKFFFYLGRVHSNMEGWRNLPFHSFSFDENFRRFLVKVLNQDS